MAGKWHRQELPVIASNPDLRHRIVVYREGFSCWSFRVWATDGRQMRCWAAGVTATRTGAGRLARRQVRRISREDAARRFNCEIVLRLGWCTGLRCYRWFPPPPGS